MFEDLTFPMLLTDIDKFVKRFTDISINVFTLAEYGQSTDCGDTSNPPAAQSQHPQDFKGSPAQQQQHPSQQHPSPTPQSSQSSE